MGTNSTKLSKKLLSERKWAFVLIFYILFFIPCFYFWANNIDLKDKCMAWITCIVVGLALCGIDLFLKKKGEKIYLFILFALSVVPNMIVWGYLFESSLCMKKEMFWVIFTTHAKESKEYLGDFISWEIFTITIIYLLLGIFFIIKAKSKHSLNVKKHLAPFVFSIIIVLTSIIFQYTVQAIPSFDFYKSIALFYQKNQKFEKEKELRKHLKMDVECLLPDSTKHVFVVILGESASTCHMSLYGYHRKTTPHMDSIRDELSVYQDVVTSDNHTLAAMQKILTFATHEHPEHYMQKPSVVEMFNAAGFETYWVSNATLLSKWGNSYGIVAKEAKHLYDLGKQGANDEVIIPSLQKALNDNVQKNKIIFIHVKGNHHAYNCRYPVEYDRFDHEKDNDLPDLGFRDKKMMDTIDEYDNSILYGDFFYSLVLENLKKQNTSSFLLFFSDHGEEVNDTRDARGHFMTDVYPCQAQVPFVFWQSEQYKAEMPEIVIDTTRPYSIENVIFSLSTLSALKYDDYDESKSIFSKEYLVPEKRIVGDETIEEIRSKVEN